MKCVYVVLSFVALISAELKTRDVLERESLNVNLNQLMDYSNPQIAQFIVNRGLDPLNLPYTEKKLWTPSQDSVEPMLYKADLILYSGMLKYLSFLKRYGDATLTYEGKIVKMEMGLAFQSLQATYNYIVKMGLFDLNGRIIATAEDVSAKISIMFNTSDYTLLLNKLEIQTPGRIKAIVENKNGGTDAISTAIINIVIPYFQKTITSSVQTEAVNAIQMYLDKINRMIVPHKESPSIFNY